MSSHPSSKVGCQTIACHCQAFYTLYRYLLLNHDLTTITHVVLPFHG